VKVALIILDGWGIADHGRLNAIRTANTPRFDQYTADGAYGLLAAAGRHVGLPEGQASNSEVGHLNIGTGRVIKQAYTRINDAIEDGTLAENEVVRRLITNTKRNGGRLHFMGLVSDGGVHSDMKHLFELIKIASENNVECVTHAFTDGRDAPPYGASTHFEAFRDVVQEYDNGHPATVMGRYYAMDRNENWDRTKAAYDAIVNREADWQSSSALAAIDSAYDRDETDEFISPTIIEGGSELRDNDSVFFFNFRPDRSRQLVQMLLNIDPTWPSELSPPVVELATLTQYYEAFDIPVAFSSPEIECTLGEILEANDLTQFRIAESEKYAHVTYFFNGGREIAFENERREIVPSPDVDNYVDTPEMSACAVTDTAIDTIDREDPDVMVLNYANPDMVGHTGNFEATVRAVEFVDSCLGRLVEVCRSRGADVLLMSDHGTADDMGTEDDPNTAHTTNPVPFVHLAPGDDPSGGRRVRPGGSLCDVAPTLLELVGVEKPAAMTGESLLE
jgi:2,3-bisphosphoglycerate-independent phosphoglycerate mutase